MAVTGCLLLGGCSGYDVQVDAPMLEHIGLISESGSDKEKVAETRAPLVLPPTKTLPPPGNGISEGEQVWPNDPDAALADAKSADERKQERIADGAFDEDDDEGTFDRITGRTAPGRGIFGGYEEKAAQE